MTIGPIQNPRSKTSGRRPGDGVFRQLLDGEIFVNQADGAVVTMGANGSPIEFNLVNPTAPTRPLTDGSTKVATMEALQNAIAAILGGLAPGALSTLKGLADALGEDPTAFADIMSALALRVRVDANQGLTSTQISQALGNINAVQQGGGAGQGTNKVYLGWSGTDLKAQVDATDLGVVWSGASCTQSLGVNSGYIRFPPGSDGQRLMYQWTRMTNPSGQFTWVYPTSFPTACFSARGDFAKGVGSLQVVQPTGAPGPSSAVLYASYAAYNSENDAVGTVYLEAWGY